jgi:hypothetical protein
MKELLCSMLGLFCLSGEPIDLTDTQIMEEKQQECLEELSKYLSPNEAVPRCEELFPIPNEWRLTVDSKSISGSEAQKAYLRYKEMVNIPLPAMTGFLPQELVDEIEQEAPGFLVAVEALQAKHIEVLYDRVFMGLAWELKLDLVEYLDVMETPIVRRVTELTFEMMPALMQKYMEELLPEMMALAEEWDQQ